MASNVKVPTELLERWQDLADTDATLLATEVRDFTAAALKPPEVKRPVVPIKDFLGLARETLGDKAVVPRNAGPAFYAKVVRMLRNGGVEDVDKAAVLLTYVASWVKDEILIDTIAAKSGGWLALALARGRRAPPKALAPAEMEIE